MAVVRVPLDIDRLVRTAEPGEVGGDAAEGGGPHRGDQLAPQERPGWLAVDEHDGWPLALVDMRQPQASELAVPRLEREVGDAGEEAVGDLDDAWHDGVKLSPGTRPGC